MICQREGGRPQLKRSGMESLPEKDSPISLRTISPDPTAAEKLALEEIKDLILKRCPQVEMIVHLGTYPNPVIFYLLVLISDDERTPEHQVSNKIEDNCQYLAHVHAVVHKANSAKEALNVGKRFWSTVMEKGFVLYQSPELVLPEHGEMTKRYYWKERSSIGRDGGSRGLSF